MGDPDLVAAAVALPAGEDDRPAGGGADGRPVVGGDVEAVVAVVEVLADVVAAAETGQRKAPPLYVAGARDEPPRLPERGPSSPVGLGTGMALPIAPGMDEHLADDEVRILELVGVEDLLLVRPCTWRPDPASVSDALTVRTRPVTGGMVRVWPRWRSSLDLRLFAHHRVIIETPNLEAMPVSVSPDLTL